MGNLQSAVDEIRALDPAELGEELGPKLVQLRREIDQLEAGWTQLLQGFDRSGRWADDGALSAKAWLRHHCRMAPGAASERVAVARRLSELPATEAAFADGDISYSHVRVITRATGDLQPSVVDELEPVLAETARELDPSKLRTAAEHCRHAFEPGKFLDVADDAYQARRFDISETFEGRHVVDGEFHPEGGAIIATAVHAAETTSKDDPRTPKQRRADALEAICRSYLDRRVAATTGGEWPHLNVSVDLRTLERRAGAKAATVAWSGQPISGEAARRLACDAGISRIITDGKSEPLDVGRRTRVVPAPLRRAVITRDRQCVEVGCDRPPEWCDVHHIVHWLDGGPTALHNLELRCHPHHRDEHEGRRRDRSPPVAA
ncbi:MAG: DUF222 domain-containing protein [Actinomycetota bacterium]